MKRKLISTLLLTTAIALPLGVGAQTTNQPRAAQSPTGAPPDKSDQTAPANVTGGGDALTFKGLDANRDNYISRDEARGSPELMRRFNDLDTDRDGKLSAQEMNSFRPAREANATPDRNAPRPMNSTTPAPSANSRDPQNPGGDAGAGSKR